jgi:phage gp29-like protein
MPPGNGQSLFPHGAGFISLFGGGAARVYWPSDQALKRARQHAVLMRADASIMECVELRQRAVALLDWRIECERESDPEYLRARDLLETICQRIPRFMQYRENLLHAIWFGRYAIANRYRWDWLDGQKLVVVASWIPIHGDKLVWKIDADGGSVLDGIGVRVGGGAGLSEQVKRWRDQHRAQIESTDYGWAYFPPPGMRDLLIVHRHYIEDGEYEEPRNAGKIFGVGIRDRIYWTWYQRQEALAWLMEFLERSAFGIELWYYPAGNPQGREEMKQAAAERVGPGKNILLIPRPPGMEGAAFGVERIEPSMAGAQVLKEILTDFFGHQIKRYILGQTLTTEAHATGLGSNLASIHLDTFLQIVRYDAINLQETLTEQLVRRLVIWNWPHLDATAFRFVIELEKDDTRERLEGIRAAFDMGLKIKAAEIRDLLNLSQPGEDEEFLQNPAYRQSALPGQEMGGPTGLPPSFEAVPSETYSLPQDVREQIRARPGLTTVRSELTGGIYQKVEGRWVRVDSEPPAGAKALQRVSGAASLLLSPSLKDIPKTTLSQQAEAAERRFRSPRHLRLKGVLKRALAEAGIERANLGDAIGAWMGGAENSFFVAVQEKSEPKLVSAVCQGGLAAEQKAVGYFVPDVRGRAYRWVGLFEKDWEELEKRLTAAGVTDKTLVPAKDGILVMVMGEGEEFENRVQKLHEALRPKSFKLEPGRLRFIGAEPHEGMTDREWRKDSARVFHREIRRARRRLGLI